MPQGYKMRADIGLIWRLIPVGMLQIVISACAGHSTDHCEALVSALERLGGSGDSIAFAQVRSTEFPAANIGSYRESALSKPGSLSITYDVALRGVARSGQRLPMSFRVLEVVDEDERPADISGLFLNTGDVYALALRRIPSQMAQPAQFEITAVRGPCDP